MRSAEIPLHLDIIIVPEKGGHMSCNESIPINAQDLDKVESACRILKHFQKKRAPLLWSILSTLLLDTMVDNFFRCFCNRGRIFVGFAFSIYNQKVFYVSFLHYASFKNTIWSSISLKNWLNFYWGTTDLWSKRLDKECNAIWSSNKSSGWIFSRWNGRKLLQCL